MTVAPPAYWQLPVTPGDPLLLKLRVKSLGAGTLYNLGGTQVRLSIWDTGRTVEFASATGVLVDPAAGRVNITLPGLQTLGVPDGARFDVLFVNSLGRRRYLIYGVVAYVQGTDGGNALLTGDDIDGGTASVTGPELSGGTA